MSSPATTELRVTGMTCNNCARKVTEAAQKIPGVHSVSVNVAAAHASVRWNSDADKNVAAVLTAIARAGFEANELSPAARETHQSRWQWNLIIGLGVTGVLMLGEWVFGLAMTPWFRWLAFVLAGGVQWFCGRQFYAGAWRQLKAGQSNMDTLVALGSTTAFSYSTWALLSAAGGHLYFMEAAAIIALISFGHWLEARVSDQASAALKSLLRLAPQTARRLALHRDTLPWGAISPNRRSQRAEPVHGALVHGDAPGAPTADKSTRPGSNPALKPFGPPLAGEAGGEARPSLKSFSFSPSEVRNRKSEVNVATATATEAEVPVSELRINDLVVLRPGDRVPVDGVVCEGESAVDEAMLTGESAPAEKKAGGELFAGTVNLNGRLVLRVTATGEATALAHIIAAVQRAQTSRAEIQRLGDRISSVFVPVIVVLALGAGLWWGLAPASASHVHDFLSQFLWPVHAPAGAAAGFIIAAAVLIIACPCAMGLATPAAIMASANAAARRGILVRDGVALEKAGKITALVLDKTGTLTTGELAVFGTWFGDDSKPAIQRAQTIAAALGRPSGHPVSQVIARLSSDSVCLENWREIAGGGVQAHWRAETGALQSVRLGSLTWLRENGAELPANKSLVESWNSQGAGIVGLAVENAVVAMYGLKDALKPGAAKVVHQLQARGLRTFLLTGDNSRSAAAIAKELGIAPANVLAEVRPEQKAEFVKKIQAAGERVAFVGDGINDAPALTQADLGIAVSRASDIAREAADIVLLKSEIGAVPEALGLARATLRTIKQNLFWAFFYNALGVPLAALGFISPVFCAVAMGFSDLIVIGNALRLLRWKNPANP